MRFPVSMSRTYRPWNPDQKILLPPSPRSWLPEDHLVYFLLDVIEELPEELRRAETRL